MASVNDRLGRLEARQAPPPHRTAPIVDLVMKDMNAQRLELDGRPPDPYNEPTPEELEAGREATRNFLPYLLGERERSHPTHWKDLDHWILETKAEIEKLDEEDAR